MINLNRLCLEVILWPYSFLFLRLLNKGTDEGHLQCKVEFRRERCTERESLRPLRMVINGEVRFLLLSTTFIRCGNFYQGTNLRGVQWVKLILGTTGNINLSYVKRSDGFSLFLIHTYNDYVEIKSKDVVYWILYRERK